MRPKLLDLFCKAGGASMGYHRAGFDVIGVDIEDQPNYPFPFNKFDALEYVEKYGHLYDVIAASPPCQAHSTVSGQSKKGNADKYPCFIAPIREALVKLGKPFVIENVVGAPLKNAAMLCGSAFGLDVRRHRLFETNWLLLSPGCNHAWQTPRFRSLDSRRSSLASVVGVHGHINYKGEFDIRCRAMGIDWMTNAELSQAIPPAYTYHIGCQLMEALK